MFVVNKDLQLLFAHFVGLGPLCVILSKNLGIYHDPSQLLQYNICHVNLLPNQGICLVLAVVGISEPSVGLEVELKKLVAKLASVTNTIDRNEKSIKN